MPDDADRSDEPPFEEDKPPASEAILAFLEQLFRPPGGEDPFATVRDAVVSSLTELSEELQQFSESAAKAAEEASEHVAGLAAAVAGAGSLRDAVERVMGQFGADPDDRGDWLRDLFNAPASDDAPPSREASEEPPPAADRPDAPPPASDDDPPGAA